MYILKSEKDGKNYAGYTQNLKLRFEQHKNGEVESINILASNYELYLSKAYKYDGNDCLNWKKCIIGSYDWSGPSYDESYKKV